MIGKMQKTHGIIVDRIRTGKNNEVLKEEAVANLKVTHESE